MTKVITTTIQRNVRAPTFGRSSSSYLRLYAQEMNQKERTQDATIFALLANSASKAFLLSLKLRLAGPNTEILTLRVRMTSVVS